MRMRVGEALLGARGGGGVWRGAYDPHVVEVDVNGRREHQVLHQRAVNGRLDPLVEHRHRLNPPPQPAIRYIGTCSI